MVDNNEKLKLYYMIVEKYGEYIYNMVYYTVLNEEDAKDLTQEIFYKIWKGLDNFKSKSSIKTWIYRITQNHLKNFLRMRKVKKIISLDFLFEEKKMDFESKDYNKLDKIEQYLSVLPEDERRILVLFYIDGFNIKEISDILSMKEL